MKLVRLTTAYPVYLQQFYADRPGLEDSPMNVQQQILMEDAFYWADFWKVSLEPLGYDVVELVANAKPIQRAWAIENGVMYQDKDWMLTLATKRIQTEKPEILFIVDYTNFSRAWIEELRSSCPSIRVVIGWCAAPFNDPEVFKAYDLVLSCDPELVSQYRSMGHESHHVNNAFDPRILERINDKGKDSYDFTFVGQINRQARFHLEREKLLLHLVEHTPLIIFSIRRSVRGPGRYLKGIIRERIQSAYDSMNRLGIPTDILDQIPIISRGPYYGKRPLLPFHPQLKKHIRSPLFGMKMFQTLYDSKVSFNNHINISKRFASNLRMFEATGVGSCLLTDQKERIADLFEPDSEVVTYRSAEECAEKALYLLENPSQRISIAKAGQARTLRDHNFNIRAQQLDEIICQFINK
jgi:spore maturation protein CgeB